MSDEPEMVIPLDRLPPGFAERMQRPSADVAPLHPAATAVLLRDSQDGPEILLLKRHRASGFVPGAWVFPGGRVDAGDGDAGVLELLTDAPADPDPAYWLAAVRETFEETGVLLARRSDGRACPAAAGDAAAQRWRLALLAHDAALLDVLQAFDARPDISRMVHCAHWLTPEAEPRRYDTHFFLAALPEGCAATVDEREMSDSAWLTAETALRRFSQGDLPMVFPTVKTIQRLAGYATVDDMLNDFRTAAIPAIMPRLVRTNEGVGIVMPDHES